MNPIGTTADGTLIFTATPADTRAAALFAQLEAWREKGYNPELMGGRDGWLIRISTEKYEPPTMDMRLTLRMTTDLCATPQAAIEAALQVIQP